MAKKSVKELEKEINKKEVLSNAEKESRYKKRKLLLTLIMIFGLTTIVLAVLSLTIKISPIFALISFLIESILSKYREKLAFKDN